MKKFLLIAMALVAMSAAAQESQAPFVARYIDEDVLYTQYLAAQQYTQLQTKLSNEFKQAEQKKRSSIESFYNTIAKKQKNGQYKSQKAFEADQTKLEQMQTNAQKELETLQQQMERQLNAEAQKLAGDIDVFLAEYAVRNGYDAILRKNAAMFINPKWDVTTEVANELNIRYNNANAPVETVEPEEVTR